MGIKPFVPKARLIQILGEHLIKDATVGILELAKNSYDADATEVEIRMENLNLNDAKISIIDNGCGMDEHDFLNKWMIPASGHKQQQKKVQSRTRLSRLPLGEKGVGRFATQQIGNFCKLITKKSHLDEELYVEIDWSAFDDDDKDLSEIRIESHSRSAEIFKGKQSGTLLEISKLKSQWKENDIKRIANSLKRMKSPFKGANNFNIRLKFMNCSETFYKYENLEISDILEKAHYKFVGLISEQGILDFDVEFQLPGFEKKHKTGELSLQEYSDVSNPGCGGFMVNFFVYDQSADYKYLKMSQVSSQDLKEFAGVSVYRDGIRVLPYGEKDNDWLKLDYRRIQAPGKRISKDQIIGMVEINQIENLSLKDKTNREGLIENEEYLHFEKLVLATIITMENEILPWRKEKREKEEQEKRSKQNVQADIDNIKSKLSEAAEIVKAADPSSDAGQIIEQAEKGITEVNEQIKQSIEDYEHVNKTLFNLAGTGLAAERFTHEFARLVSGANISMERLKKLINYELPKIKKEVDTITGALEALRNDIRLLGPMFYIKKVAREKLLDIRQIIDNTVSLQEHWLEKESIDIEIIGDSFNVSMREGSCMQVFNNLIDNAIFWLSRKSEFDKRKIRIIINVETSSVFISDSGPGIVTRYKDKIFDPFFSMKGEEGRGLGLYIAKEILEEKNWNIITVDQDDHPGLLKGASFKIVFKSD